MIVGVVILGVTLLSGWWFWRVDFTADQRYSLAPVSQTVLEEIDAAYPGEAVEVTVLLDGHMSSDFQLLRTEVEALLYDMKSVMRRIQGGESRGCHHIKFTRGAVRSSPSPKDTENWTASNSTTACTASLEIEMSEELIYRPSNYPP